MATSESRRRKQLEKKKKKRSEKQRQSLVRRNAGIAEQLQMRLKWPVYECTVADSLRDSGMGHVMISRRSASDEIAVSHFLIDRYCMGVKDCFARIMSQRQYNELKAKIARNATVHRPVNAATARRLVEDAVAYADNVGLKPHADYRSCRVIFGDIDSSQATTLMEMGRAGKPHFVRGPFQSEAECLMIINRLTEKCGPDGFTMSVNLSPPYPFSADFDLEELPFSYDEDDCDDDEPAVIGCCDHDHDHDHDHRHHI